MPFVATWMDLEGIMLSEISQIKKNTVYITYMESKKYNKLVNITKRSGLTSIENTLMITSGRGKWRRGIIGVGEEEV